MLDYIKIGTFALVFAVPFMPPLGAVLLFMLAGVFVLDWIRTYS